jgi:hypothetical protein
MELIATAVAAGAFLIAGALALVDTGDRLRDRDPLGVLSAVGAVVSWTAAFGAVALVLEMLSSTP